MNTEKRGGPPKRIGEVVNKLVPVKRRKNSKSPIYLVEKRVEKNISTEEISSNQLGFITPTLVQANLPLIDPHKKNPELNSWTRRNGNFRLTIQPLVEQEEDGTIIRNYGFPYGVHPRLIIIYICLQVKRYRSPELSLGRCISDFMQNIGIRNTGGEDYNRVKSQAVRLFTSRVHCRKEGKITSSRYEMSGDMSIAEKSFLWWDERESNQAGQLELFDSYVVLKTPFFNSILEKGIPIDLEAVMELRDSCLALDLYMWLTYRVYGIKKDAFVSWKDLKSQTGATGKSLKRYREHAITALKKVNRVWPTLKLEDTRGGFIIKKETLPHVKRLFVSSYPALPPANKDSEASHRGY